eukprot:scaffold312667_cov35-Tisochrysis_lutea.AAC.2
MCQLRDALHRRRYDREPRLAKQQSRILWADPNAESLFIAVTRERCDPQLEQRRPLHGCHLGLANKQRLARGQLFNLCAHGREAEAGSHE